MIIGDTPLADGARKAFPEVPFTWIMGDIPILDDVDDGATVVVSQPVMIGTVAALEALYPRLRFAYVPENVRAAHPGDWAQQARYIIGTRHMDVLCELAKFFAPTPIVLMTPESAEMTKHALNGFLAVSVTYANEVAVLARKHGANPAEVAEGVMSDPRIGWGAYLKPGPRMGDHLAREVHRLQELGGGRLIDAIRP